MRSENAPIYMASQKDIKNGGSWRCVGRGRSDILHNFSSSGLGYAFSLSVSFNNWDTA